MLLSYYVSKRSKIILLKEHVWLGSFYSEEAFNRYLDQTEYLKAWAKYNFEEAKEGEIDEEPSLTLRCQFCKEIGQDTYDDDFIVIQYNKNSNDIKQLISIIPADAQKLLDTCTKKGLVEANSLIYYEDDELSTEDALKTTSITYLGYFEEETSTVIGGEGLHGLTNHLWVGITKKNKEEFMKYFNQAEYLSALEKDSKPSIDLRCQFCKDVGINYYNPDFLHVFYSQEERSIEEIIKKYTPDPNLHNPMISDLHDNDIYKANGMFCYIDNGCRDPKKDQIFLIYKRSFEGIVKKSKKFVDEKDNYNDLQYIGAFEWD